VDSFLLFLREVGSKVVRNSGLDSRWQKSRDVESLGRGRRKLGGHGFAVPGSMKNSPKSFHFIGFGGCES
jgi:hypothetical protein